MNNHSNLNFKKAQLKKAFSLIELSVVVLIIGILIAGISQSSRLVRAMKLSTARSLTRSSDVNSIQNLTAWFDATAEGVFSSSCDYSAGIVSNYTTNYEKTSANTSTLSLIAKGTKNYTQPEHRQLIRLWKDSSPQKTESDRVVLENFAPYNGTSADCQAIDYNVANYGYGPMYHQSGINGLPSVFFKTDGVSAQNTLKNILSSVDPVTMPIQPGDKDFAIFVVFVDNHASTIGWDVLLQLSEFRTGADNKKTLSIVPDTAGCSQTPGRPSASLSVVNDRGNCVNDIYFNQSSTMKPNVNYALGFNLNFNSPSSSGIYINSDQKRVATVAGTPSNLDLAASQLTVGGGYASNGTLHALTVDGFFSEALIFDRKLTDEEASSVMAYLVKKYNIKAL